jgi:hypothetical protein
LEASLRRALGSHNRPLEDLSVDEIASGAGIVKIHVHKIEYGTRISTISTISTISSSTGTSTSISITL